MNTANIEAFLAILKRENITEAAKDLFISQSTLSHRLSELEREVGVPLIERRRGGKALILTDYGKEFFVLAKRWQDLCEDTKRIKSQVQEMTLAVGAVDTFHRFIFPPLYKRLLQERPDIHLNIKTYNSTELYLLIDRGELDIAFPLFQLPMQNVLAQEFYTERRVVIRRDNQCVRGHEQLGLTQLDERQEIFFVGDNAFHDWYHQWKGRVKYPVLQVDTTPLLSLFLDREGAWSVVPLCIAETLYEQGGYSYYELTAPPPMRRCYSIRQRYPKARTAECLQIFDAYLEEFKKGLHQ